VFTELSKLFERSIGGSDVAASPTKTASSFWPEGNSPVGVDEAVRWFKASSDQSKPVFLFLVGAPGGGKSHISRKLVEDYEEINPKRSKIAHRSHVYQAGALEVLLVNDATIKSAQAQESLTSEISDCIDNHRALIACVNRGVLVEETASAEESEERTLLNWISNPDKRLDSESLTVISVSPYLAHALLVKKEIQIEICVVYVDACSLLERAPRVTLEVSEGGKASFNCEEYRLEPLSKRSEAELNSIAGLALIREMASTLAADPDTGWGKNLEFNPLAANIENLSQDTLVTSLGTVLRSAELVNNKKFSYRELWGLISRLFIGNSPLYVNASGLEVFFQNLQPKNDSPAEIFEALQNLAAYRFHQSMFGVVNVEIFPRVENLDIVSSALAKVDPVIDAMPGTHSAAEPASGWVDFVYDAFAGSENATSPLKALTVLAESNPGDQFPRSITEFDRQLDEAFSNLLSTKDFTESQYSKNVRWYATYLTRMYATSNGISAFRDSVATWVELWTVAPALPSAIEKRFLTLLRPKLSEDSSAESLIPLFDSRTTPFNALPLQPKLAIQLDDIRIQSARNGDSLFLKLSEKSSQVAEILVDFALIRSALVCAEEHLGVSDLTLLTQPRLERLRAARLAPELLEEQRTLKLLTNSQIQEVVIAQ
jgi:hypothetical protein